ncbi:vegetative cell wall protein gp1 [Lycium barbarum]|uniref:vegetative cell wall protein gp1 n=1 Tax=Lycium barbarum TaxID=112863 RepID=UPI00293F0BC5|nr:vegetative cell wall protein gp1 [Lycium barbarum]
MASQQQPRPLFRFASMVRPAAQTPAPATPAPASQPLFRPTTPFRPPSPAATTTTQPPQPQEPAQQPPATTAPPVAAVAAPPKPEVPAPRSPISAPQPQSVAAASPRSTLATPAPRSSPVAPPQSVVSPPKVPSPRSPVATQPQRAATDVPKSPVTKVTTSVPQSPFRTQSAPTSTPYSSLPPSPKTKMADSVQTLINQSSPSKAPTPSQKVIQPNVVKSQTYSPQTKPTLSHPPSPLKLPPSQLELESKIPPQVDQKSVVVHETTRANTNSHHVMQTTRNGKTVENGKRESLKKDKGVQQKKASNSDTTDDFGMSVLTLAGENKGAIMELSPSRKTYSPQSLQKKGSPKAWSSEDDEEKSGSESGRKGDRMQNKSLPMNAFMNSNVQGINNSILHNASCTHHDPGVHLVFGRKAHGSNGSHIKGSPRSQNNV